MNNAELKIKNEHLILSDEIVQAAGNDELIAKILVNRGINTQDEILKFMHFDSYKPLQVEDFPALNDAVKIICQSIACGEKIAIYGDYDVDGITATTILLECLRKFTNNIIYHVPDRFTEGYGMNSEVVKSLALNDVNLIISCDCGISNIQEVQTAKQLGLKIIITDHHTIPENIPPADAILNPKIFSHNHPAYNLSGCGVAYFLCLAILKHYGREEEVAQFLDLVTLSIIADSVPLIGENRYLLKSGLPHIFNSNRIGLNALYRTIRDNTSLSQDDVAFQITPRINAAGRLDSARLPVELLLSNDFEQATLLANKINNLNIIRKDIQQRMVDSIIKIVENEKMHKNIIILYNDGWHQGVIGIAAGKIAEKYRKPVILLTLKQDPNTIIGSARSIPGVNIYDILKQCSHCLTKFGGHPMAGGLSLQKQNLERFIFSAEDIAIKLYPGTDTIDYYADACIELSEINQNLYDRIISIAPYGEEFEQPTFISRNITILNDRITDKGHHFLILSDKNQCIVPAIRWSGGNTSYKNGIYNILYTIYLSPDSESTNGYSLKAMINHMVKLKEISNGHEILFQGNIIDGRAKSINELLKSYPQATIFFEGLGAHNLLYKTKTRNTIKQSETLILLSIPMNTDVLKEIICLSRPQNLIINFSQNPDYMFNNFMQNVLGVIKHIINKKNGIASIGYFEQTLCVEENILKTAFTYLRNYGKIEFEIDYRNNMIAFEKPNYNPEATNTLQIEHELKNALHDKNAYKRYMQNINIDTFNKLIAY